jgi:hypothetical protein
MNSGSVTKDVERQWMFVISITEEARMVEIIQDEIIEYWHWNPDCPWLHPYYFNFGLPPDPQKQLMDEWRANERFFYDNKEDLLGKYKGRCIAISRQEVIASGENERELRQRVYKEKGPILVLIQKVEEISFKESKIPDSFLLIYE